MSDKTAFHKLINSLDKRRIMDAILGKEFESILKIEVYYKKVPVGRKYFFYQRKEMVPVVKFKVNEDLSIIEHMTKGLDFQELTYGHEYEIEYV